FGSSGGTGVVAWHSRYPTQLQGIFFDNGPSFDLSQSTWTESQFQSYYEPKYSQVHASPYAWQVMLNASQFPGTASTSQPQDWILAGCPSCTPPASPAADYVVVWEQVLGE